MAAYDDDSDDLRELSYVNFYANRARCRYEFTRPYVGGDTLPQQLQSYVVACARQYAAAPTQFCAPLVSIVQSSGFGKSRLLRELAHRTKDDAAAPMKVLYTCVRPSSVQSSGYPEATRALRDYLFPFVESRDRDPEHVLTVRLISLYAYAWSHWHAVGSEWFALFDDQADAAIRQRLETHTTDSEQATTARDDDQLREEQLRVLVLTIDEARYLSETDCRWNKHLYHALAAASRQIRATFGQHAWIFAILVDTSPSIIGRYDDPPSGSLGQELFPPFVLTQTMDVRFKLLIDQAKRDSTSSKRFYKELVARNYNDAWPALAAMGRPLWDRVKREHSNEPEEPANVIQLATTKVLVGLSAVIERNVNEDFMVGVASVLRHVGLRPGAWSQWLSSWLTDRHRESEEPTHTIQLAADKPLASSTVEWFMATLLHVNASHDQLITTYASEPVLAFGAARVWYQSAAVDDPHVRLADDILPHFGDLLCHDVVDTGGIHSADLVARLVLLLAMDATGVVVTAPGEEGDARQYQGSFRSVETFLSVLYGDQPLGVRYGKSHCSSTEDVRALRRQWREWKVGFSHFVQLSKEPTETELWALLARRAAGTMPRGHDAVVDLLIPIFHGTDVSMMLVAATDGDNYNVSDESMFLSLLRPSAVFTNAFRQLDPGDVVRVWMRWQGPQSSTRTPCFLVDNEASPSSATSAATDSFVLCIDGLAAWDAPRYDRKQNGSTPDRDHRIPVLSERLASELRKLLGADPWRQPMSMVESDLRYPQPAALPPDVVRSIASRPLVDSLLSD